MFLEQAFRPDKKLCRTPSMSFSLWVHLVNHDIRTARGPEWEQKLFKA